VPLVPQQENYQAFPGPQSLIIRSECLNIQTQAQGVFNTMFAGIQFGVTLPFVHVVRLGGRYFLHNGYHRTNGVRASGATHVPCIVRDVPDFAAAGVRADGTTLPETAFTGADQPTMLHYAQGRAAGVSLRTVNRILHVSWAEYAIPVE
jgi:hypothetical protein